MPLRLPRAARAAAVASLMAAPIAALALPAHASVTPRAEYWLSTLHVTQAWKAGEGTGVVVAVLADGVVPGQPDISGSVIVGPDFTGSGRSPGGPHYGVIGTGLASLIVGHGHAKGLGIVGVAAAAKVLSIRVTLSPGDPLWSRGRITSRLPDAIAAGIRYAVHHGATIIELPADPGMADATGRARVPASAGPSAAERAAIAYAVSRGIVLVAPAGDNAQFGDAVTYPAAYPGVIAVGSLGKNSPLAPSSSRQPYVTLTAAGEQVVAAAPTGYQTMNSTWAASALVAGVAALVRSQFPALTAAQVWNSLIHGTSAARPGGSANGAGYGTVDAQGAIRRAMTMSPPGANLAMKGALPRLAPVSPHVQSLGSSISSALVRDGVISAAALVALLALVFWYGSAAKQRDRQALLAAERGRQERARPEQATMLADPLLEYFGPQHARPVDRASRPRAAVAPRFQPTSQLAGRPALAHPARATRLGQPSPGTAVAAWATQRPDHDADAEPPGMGSAFSPVREPTSGPARQATDRLWLGAPSGPDAGNGGAGPGLGPSTGNGGTGGGSASRQAEPRIVSSPISADPEPTVRHTTVTGSPPWEPAPEPTTALPWAPSVQIGGFRPTASHRPDGRTAASGIARYGLTPRLGQPSEPGSPAPDDGPARSAPPRSLFEPGPVAHLSAPTPGSPTASDPGTGPLDSGGRPIYVWNPESSNPQPSNPELSNPQPSNPQPSNPEPTSRQSPNPQSPAG